MAQIMPAYVPCIMLIFMEIVSVHDEADYPAPCCNESIRANYWVNSEGNNIAKAAKLLQVGKGK